jgi:hypothetical protein
MTLHEKFKQDTCGPDILVLVWTPQKGMTLHEKFRQGSGGLDMLVFVCNHSKVRNLIAGRAHQCPD